MVQRPFIKGCLRGDLQGRVLTFCGGVINPVLALYIFDDIWMYLTDSESGAFILKECTLNGENDDKPINHQIYSNLEPFLQ